MIISSSRPQETALLQHIAELEEQLAQCKQKYALLQDIYDYGPLAYQSLDAEGKLMHVNQSWLAQTGYKREEVINHHFSEFLPPHLQAHFQLYFPRFKALGEVLGAEFELITKDGTAIQVAFDGKIHTDAAGTFLRTHCVFQNISSKREVERELWQSRERYRLITESIKDVVWLMDVESQQYLYISPSVTRLTGYTPEEILALPAFAIFSEQQGQALQEETLIRAEDFRQGLLATDHFHTEDVALPHKDGSFTWTEVISSFRNNPDTGRVELMGVTRDISERREAEEALKKSEAQHHAAYTLMRLLCDNVPDMIWAKDLNKRYIFTNTALCRDLLNAESTEEPLGKTDLFFALRERRRYPDNPDWHTFGEICRDTDTLAVEHSAQQQFHESGNVQGHFLHLDVRKAPLVDENGQVIGTVGSARNVTKLKLMEQKLKDSEERLALALLGADLGSWDWQITNDTFTFNDRFASMLGYQPQELPQSIDTLHNAIHPEDLQQTKHRLQKHLAGYSQAFESEHRLRHQHGHWIWVLAKGRVTERDEHGRPIRACGTHLDITARKNADKERRILQSQLVQAQKMEAIGTLAGGIAHDFNNILGAILGYAELAREGIPENSVAAQDLDKVLESGMRAATLVKQILAFSRQSETERVPLKPAGIVKEALKLLRPTLPSTIAIDQWDINETKAICADPAQLHQILMNLCTNAFHAMEETGGRLTVSLIDWHLSAEDLAAHPELQQGQYIKLIVRDTGSGIPPELHPKIFDPYFTTKEVGKGTGMGLAIVHGLVTSYHGMVSCESSPGKGTTFTVLLPAADQEERPDLTRPEEPAVGKERILFVDDEQILAELGQAMLKRQGYEVTMYTSSSEALAAFETEPERFDLVITDQTMPELTGIQMAQQMMTIKPELPIILCTGYSSVISEKKARDMGISGFALKPLTQKEMASLIKEVLASTGGRP